MDGYTQRVGRVDSIRLSSVDFRGGLRVTDPGAFAATLVSGLGHAKAFGWSDACAQAAMTVRLDV